MAVPLDVADDDNVKEAAKQIIDKWGKIDLVIFNAGIYEPSEIGQLDSKTAKKVLEVNLGGAFSAVASVLPHFIENKKGHIALVASVAGYRGLPHSRGYGASKAGLISFAETLRAELSSQNIKVQVINPGFVKTRLTDKNDFNMPCIITCLLYTSPSPRDA